jgi:hypothetical protein
MKRTNALRRRIMNRLRPFEWTVRTHCNDVESGIKGEHSLGDKAIENLDKDLFRDYAWNYFALHSDQRMKAFHFYIILSTAIAGGLFVLVKSGEMHKWMAAFGALLIFFSFIFWKFDLRTRQLIKHAEAALKFLDEQHGLADVDGLPHPLKIFSREEVVSKKLPLYPLATGHFSYARCLRWIFALFSILGAALVCICLVVFPA